MPRHPRKVMAKDFSGDAMARKTVASTADWHQKSMRMNAFNQ